MIHKKRVRKTLFLWVDSGARTHDTRNHNPMLCQLSYNHHVHFLSKAGAKVLLFFYITKYFSKKIGNLSHNYHFMQKNTRQHPYFATSTLQKQKTFRF